MLTRLTSYTAEKGEHPMELPQIASTYIDTFSRHDLDAWLATFAPDGTLSDPATAQHPLAEQALKDVVGGFFAGFPDAITAGLAVWRWVIRGTHTGSYRGLPPPPPRPQLAGRACITFANG